MPPKYKFRKEEIVTAALELVRTEGIDALTARALAQKLNSSSKVIFGLFENMEELHRAVLEGANDLYFSYLHHAVSQNRYPPYKSTGMAYIRFAIEEKELFKLLFMCDRRNREESIVGNDFQMAVDMIREANNISKEQASLLHTEMWVCVHGIATMHATSFLTLEEETISRILTDTYQGLRHRHLFMDTKTDTAGCRA